MSRPAELGPGRVNGWEAFSRLDAAIAGAAVLSLLSPLTLPRPVARLLAALLGSAAAVVVIYKLARLTLIPPLSVAPQDSSAFIPADRALVGPYLALVAAAVLAGLSGLETWRGRAERSWPSAARMALGLTALAAVLRFAALGEQSVWYDELATAEVIDGDLSTAWDAYTATEATPPLFYALTWIWTHLFGSGDAALRTVSAAAMTAAVPVTFLAARSFVSERAALLAAALVAVNPTMVWYGQEARAYGLLVLFAALSLWATGRVRRTPTPGPVAVWAIVAALALFVHFFAIFLLVAEAIVIVRACRPRPRALAPAALLLAPVAIALLALADRLGGGVRTGFIGTIPLGDRTGDIVRELASNNTWLINANTGTPPAALGVLTTVVLVGVVIAALALRRRSGAAMPLLLAAGALLLPLLLSPTKYDYVLDRNLLPAWIPLAMALGAALAVLPRLPRTVAVAVLIGAALVTNLRVATEPGLQRADWKSAVTQLGVRTEGRVVAVNPHFNRGMVPRYGVRASLIGPAGIRTREIDLIGEFDAASVAAALPGFSVVAGRQYPLVNVAALRAPHRILVTPASISAAGFDPVAVLVEPSARAADWIPLVLERIRGWREAIEGDPQALIEAGEAARAELEPAPADIPDAASTTRLLIEASERGAEWAAALESDPAEAADAAAAFDRAIAAVPGAAEAVAPLTAVEATRAQP